MCVLQVIASLCILLFTEWLVVLFLSICIPVMFWNNEQGIEEVAVSSSHLQDVKKSLSHQVEETVMQIRTIKIMNINNIMSAFLQVQDPTSVLTFAPTHQAV